MRISETVPSLLGGISKQDPRIRMESQVEASLNAIPHPVYGLVKRPGTVYKGNMPGGGIEYVKYSDTKTGNAYALCIGRGFVTATLLSNPALSVTVEDVQGAFSYLSTAELASDIRTVQVKEKMFVLNRRAIPREIASPHQDPATIPKGWLVWIKQGAYNLRYDITVNGTRVQHITGQTNPDQATPESIGHALRNLLVDPPGPQLPSGDVIHQNGVLWIRQITDGFGDQYPDFVTVGEQAAGSYMGLVYGTAQRFSDLPPIGINGFRVTLTASPETRTDDYSVRFVRDLPWDFIGPGLWVECAALDSEFKLDRTTMPIVIEATGLQDIKVSFGVWEGRTAGDTKSNPSPSFVGARINDMFIHRNRLGFLTDSTVVLSRPAKYEQFYRSTVTRVQDDDPIDVTGTHPRMTRMHSAAPFDDSLLIFADQAQFVLVANGTLTTKTVDLQYKSSHELNPDFKPFAVESVLYALSQAGNTSYIREFYRDQSSDKVESINTTSHIPGVFPETPTRSAVCSIQNTAFFYSGLSDTIMSYRWMFDGPSNKLQNSWSQWRMSGKVVGMVHHEHKMIFFVTNKPEVAVTGDVRIEEMDLSDFSVGPQDGSVVGIPHARVDCLIDFSAYFDRAVEVVNGNTSYILPVYLKDPVAIVQKPSEGVVAKRVLSQSSVLASGITSITVAHDASKETTPLVGTTYDWSVTLSPVYARDKSSEYKSAITSSRLQIKGLKVNYTQTGYMAITTTPLRRSPRIQTVEQIQVSGDVCVNSSTIRSGTATVPVDCRNEDYKVTMSNTSILPSGIISYDWEGFTIPQASRR